MDAQKFKEPLPENEREPNPSSKKAIKSLKESPDASDLYWLQLVQLCLDKGLVSLPRPEFAQAWESLSRLKPEELQKFLEGPSQEEGNLAVLQPDPNWEPDELAWNILSALEDQVAELNLGYPKPVDDLP